mmetsp:Transcript_77011/g.222678  ORF Transcript_77011/g.222678 Transcript_77011/m.222678 type:complete len:403 (-) Transcript_77011:692-1900(-)
MAALCEDVRELLQYLIVVVGVVSPVAILVHGDEGRGLSAVSDTAGAPDPLDIHIDAERQVVVQNLAHAGDVQPTRSDIRSDHHIDLAFSEALEILFALLLGEIAMEGASVHLGVIVQLFIEAFGLVLGVSEHQQALALLSVGKEPVDEFQQFVQLFLRSHLDQALGNCARGSTDDAHADEDVFVQVFLGHRLAFRREGGGEHQGLPTILRRHVELLDDRVHVGVHLHLQHPVGFVENEAVHLRHIDDAGADEVPQSARCGHQQISPFGDLLDLNLHRLLAIHPDDTEARPVEELLSLSEDLETELSRRRHDNGVREAWACVRRFQMARGTLVLDHTREGRHKERRRLAAARLRATHDVALAQGCRDGILLHRRRVLVAASADVLHESRRDHGLECLEEALET